MLRRIPDEVGACMGCFVGISRASWDAADEKAVQLAAERAAAEKKAAAEKAEQNSV
jgi:hypothetical protein